MQVRASSRLEITDDALDRDRVLFRASRASTPVGPADMRMFVQMLRYRIGGHPRILSTLAQSNAIPDRRVFAFADAGSRTMTVTVRSVHTIDDDPIDVATIARRRATSSTDPVDRALDRAAALTSEEVDAAGQRCRSELAAALREHRMLDAALAIAEGGLMSGEPIAPLTPQERQRFAADATVSRPGAALGATSPEQAKAAMPVLESLRPNAVRKAYVLDLFIANDRKTLGDAAGARDPFARVLSSNPMLAGAYKDLGDALLMAYDTPRGWRSWDEGRRIAPRFANFASVSHFEQTLATDHPECF